MTKLIQQTEQTEGLEPNSKDYLKRGVGIKNLQPKIEYDPVKEQEDKFLKLLDLKEEIETLQGTFDQLKDSFKGDLLNLEEEFEDTGEQPIIHAEKAKAKVFLRRTFTYKYTAKVEQKAEKINNLKEDLKALKEKEVRENKALLKSQKTTVVLIT